MCSACLPPRSVLQFSSCFRRPVSDVTHTLYDAFYAARAGAAMWLPPTSPKLPRCASRAPTTGASLHARRAASFAYPEYVWGDILCDILMDTCMPRRLRTAPQRPRTGTPPSRPPMLVRQVCVTLFPSPWRRSGTSGPQLCASSWTWGRVRPWIPTGPSRAPAVCHGGGT